VGGAYLPAKYEEKRKGLEVNFYGEVVAAPNYLIHDFDDYLLILKESGLINLGHQEASIR